MDKVRKRIDRMNSPVAGIDLGEKESFATYMAPDGEMDSMGNQNRHSGDSEIREDR